MGGVSRPSYTVDQHALDVARADLGLSFDVRVMLTHIRGPKNCVILGRYSGIDPFHSWHNVTVNPNATLSSVNATLWHELTHARQCEREGSFPRWDSLYRQQQAELGVPYGDPAYFNAYRAMPFEAEAWNANDLYEAGALATIIYST